MSKPKRFGYTNTDFTNSLIYARMRLLHEKTMELNKTNSNVDWQDINDDKTVPYFCPKGLEECYYGFPKIITEQECKNQSTYKIGKDISYRPGYKNGWFLNWNNGNCYKSNDLYATECKTNFDTKLKKDDLLNYDPKNQTCKITKDYCDAYGYVNYDATTNSCEMNTGQTVAEAIFGDTIARGVFGGACFK